MNFEIKQLVLNKSSGFAVLGSSALKLGLTSWQHLDKIDTYYEFRNKTSLLALQLWGLLLSS